MRSAQTSRNSGVVHLLLFLAGIMMGAGGCAGLQYGEQVSKYGRPLSKPASPPATVTVEPALHTAPIKTQQTFKALVKDAKDQPVSNALVEWILARSTGAVGDIVEVGQDPLMRELKMTNTFAISGADRNGEATITITSVREGTTHLIAVVPTIKEKSKKTAFALMKWLDAQWEFPPDGAQKVGTARTLTTTVVKASTGEPLPKYQVKWNVTSGPPAYFEETEQTEVLTETDENGAVSVTLVQRNPQAGETTVDVLVVKPEQPGTECCPPVSGVLARGTTTVQWDAPSIALEQQCPPSLLLGDTGRFNIVVRNTSKVDASKVIVQNPLPAGFKYIRSDPPATMKGQTLIWNLGDLPGGSTQSISFALKPARSGTFTNEAQARSEDGAQAQSICSVLVGEPVLSITKRCPNKGIVGDTLTFTVTALNTGTGEARGVQITDTVPAGMHHSSGQPEIARPIGILEAGASVSETFAFVADELGTFTNTAKVVADNDLLDQAACDTVIEQPRIAIQKSGPPNRFLGTTATYTIEVSNPGSASATGVVVNDTLPAGIRYEGSTPEGTYNPTTKGITWNLGSVDPGESRTLLVTGRAVSEGRHCNVVTVRTERGLRENAEACTVVKGLTALLLEVADSPDPVEIGTTTTYTIEITNQGTAAATQLKVTATLGEGMKYESSTGSTGRLVVLGRQVNFDPLASLPPKEKLTYTVTIRAVQPGDSRFRVEMNADQLTSPVIEEESTFLYK